MQTAPEVHFGEEIQDKNRTDLYGRQLHCRLLLVRNTTLDQGSKPRKKRCNSSVSTIGHRLPMYASCHRSTAVGRGVGAAGFITPLFVLVQKLKLEPPCVRMFFMSGGLGKKLLSLF